MHSLSSYVLLPCRIVILSQSPREAVFCLVCVVLVLVAVRLDLGTMMAEPCASFDVLLFCFFFNSTAAATAARSRYLRAPSLPDSCCVPLLLRQQRPRAPRTVASCTHTHAPRLSRLCSLLLAPRSVSLSVVRQLFWCLLPSPSNISLPVRPQPVCLLGAGWAGRDS